MHMLYMCYLFILDNCPISEHGEDNKRKTEGTWGSKGPERNMGRKMGRTLEGNCRKMGQQGTLEEHGKEKEENLARKSKENGWGQQEENEREMKGT